jgi:hypothetical protein
MLRLLVIEVSLVDFLRVELFIFRIIFFARAFSRFGVTIVFLFVDPLTLILNCHLSFLS